MTAPQTAQMDVMKDRTVEVTHLQTPISKLAITSCKISFCTFSTGGNKVNDRVSVCISNLDNISFTYQKSILFVYKV